jgi:hypothetical protein
MLHTVFTGSGREIWGVEVQIPPPTCSVSVRCSYNRSHLNAQTSCRTPMAKLCVRMGVSDTCLIHQLLVSF